MYRPGREYSRLVRLDCLLIDYKGTTLYMGNHVRILLNKIFATRYRVDRFANIYVQCDPIRLCIVEVRCELGCGIYIY